MSLTWAVTVSELAERIRSSLQTFGSSSRTSSVHGKRKRAEHGLSPAMAAIVAVRSRTLAIFLRAGIGAVASSEQAQDAVQAASNLVSQCPALDIRNKEETSGGGPVQVKMPRNVLVQEALITDLLWTKDITLSAQYRILEALEWVQPASDLEAGHTRAEEALGCLIDQGALPELRMQSVG